LHNLLITGNSGFIGSYLYDYFKDSYNSQGISKSVGVDISLLDDLENLSFSPDIIIHAAASLNNDLNSSFIANVVGTFNICKFAKKRKVKHLILISSISAFNHPENEYYNNYGLTKKHAEEIAEAYCKENNINLTILRFSQVYDSARKAKKSQKMIYGFVDIIKSQKEINIYGKKNPIRNYLYIDDVLKVIDDVIEKKLFGIFNVINDKSYTLEDIANIIFKLRA